MYKLPKLAIAHDVNQYFVLGKEKYLTKAQATEVIHRCSAHEGLVELLRDIKLQLESSRKKNKLGCSFPYLTANQICDGIEKALKEASE